MAHAFATHDELGDKYGFRTTVRKVTNIGDGDLVMLVVGGKGGYVGRDGRLVDVADLPKRQSMSRGEFSQ